MMPVPEFLDWEAFQAPCFTDILNKHLKFISGQ